MNNWPSELIAEFSVQPTTLCRLLVLTPVGGTSLYLTDHDEDVTIGTDTFVADHSFQPSAIENSIGGANQNLDLLVLFKDGLITYDDCLRGVYSGARLDIYIASWGNPAAGKGLYTSARVGSVALDKQRLAATFSIVGSSGRMSRKLTEQYTPTCRASFGDTRCTVDLEAHAIDFTVTEVTSETAFVQDAESSDGQFNLGTVKWLTGANAGQNQEVAMSLASGAVTLFYPPRYAMQEGDTGRIYQGCDKTLANCDAYNNRANFRGEPFVPGDDNKAVL